jgi:hypothetical protein
MKQALLLLLLSAPALACAANRNSWYTGFPKELDSSHAKHELPPALISEIPLSQFTSAEQLLASTSFVRIQNNYFGTYPNCPADTVGYLVRAVFERTNTTFLVNVVGSNLLVLGFAPGPAEPQHRSALVVCLTFKPAAVYTATGGPL